MIAPVLNGIAQEWALLDIIFLSVVVCCVIERKISQTSSCDVCWSSRKLAITNFLEELLGSVMDQSYNATLRVNCDQTSTNRD